MIQFLNFSQHASVVKMEEVRNCSDFQVLLWKYQCGFLKVYDALNILPPVIEQRRNVLPLGSTNGLFIINFIQAFDCLSYELLISKPHAYGEDTLSLKLLHLYLTKWKQRFKLHGTYTLWSEIIFELLQGSILEPLLFNMFLCKLFQFFHNLDIVKYTDGNTPHSTSINLNEVWYDLEKGSNTLFKWFTENLLKVNLENSHILAKWTQ